MELFDSRQFGGLERNPDAIDRTGDYFPTPTWAAELILQQRIPYTNESYFYEPTCGDGRWLDVIPSHIRKTGCELRADLVEIARGKGHDVIHGDALRVPIPAGITHAIGNPPFDAEFIYALLLRLHRAMGSDGLVSFILPAYVLQTSRTAFPMINRWSVDVEMIPRDIYEGLSKPLVLARFWRNRKRNGLGLFLYAETVDVRNMNEAIRGHLERKTWPQVVLEALEQLGGEASLEQLYRVIGPNRPTGNPWWKERTRTVLQERAINTGRGRWRHPAFAHAA